MGVPGPRECFPATRLALRLRLPQPCSFSFGNNVERQVRKALFRQEADRVDLILLQMTPDKVSRLHFEPWMAAVPFHSRTRDTEFGAGLVPMPPVENQPAMDQDGRLDTVLPNVLSQSREVPGRHVRKQGSDWMQR